MKISLLAEPRAKPPRAAAAAVQRARKGNPSLAGLQLQVSARQGAQRRATEAMFV